jgi:predicted metallopeptidase
MDFALMSGTAELRIDAGLSRDEDEVVAATVAADIPAVEREFERSFVARPVIYVFGSIESYTEGFVRIFGYPRATATFVALNSVSFFEPSLRLIAVNWEAVRARRPVAAIRHELTHLMTLDACAPRCDLVPAWLNEGEARLAEALVPGGEWRLVRVRYEAASMAVTGTVLPLNTLVSQLAWNGLTDWAGYFKYQESARAVELLREDVGGTAPIARIYERLRRGQNVAQAYAALTDRSFDDFVEGLPDRMRAAVPAGQGLIAVAPTSYLVYGFPPATTITVTVSGPRGSESSPMVISPFGSNFDSIAPTRLRGGYTISAQTERGVFTVKLRKEDTGDPSDMR